MSDSEQGRARLRIGVTRVPGLGGARLTVWLALAVAVLVAGTDPADLTHAELIADASGSGCRLDFSGAAAPCPCEALTGLQRRLFGWPIPLNRATPEDLSVLPGIGPVRAAAIVAEREWRGAYESVDALRRVRGIGPRSVDRFRSAVFVAGPDPACSPGLTARVPQRIER